MDFLLLVCVFYPLNALCITIKFCEVLVSGEMIWIVSNAFRAWERQSGLAPDSRQGPDAQLSRKTYDIVLLEGSA